MDALNNRCRQWKTILSIHKSKPFACVPLNPKSINITLEAAKLPLSDGVIAEAEEWAEPIDRSKRERYTRELGSLLNSAVIDTEDYRALLKTWGDAIE